MQRKTTIRRFFGRGGSFFSGGGGSPGSACPGRSCSAGSSGNNPFGNFMQRLRTPNSNSNQSGSSSSQPFGFHRSISGGSAGSFPNFGFGSGGGGGGSSGGNSPFFGGGGGGGGSNPLGGMFDKMLEWCSTSHAHEIARRSGIDLRDIKFETMPDGQVRVHVDAPNATRTQIEQLGAQVMEECPVARFRKTQMAQSQQQKPMVWLPAPGKYDR